MTTPIIGICAAYTDATWGFWTRQAAAVVSGKYFRQVQAARGIPVGLIPDAAVVADPSALLDRIDGLLLIGGDDIEPALYGQESSPLTEETQPERDQFELALTRAASERDVPVLGICRGLQIMNIATGDDLYQHLLAEGYTEHRPKPGDLSEATYHDIEVEAGSLAAQAIGAGVHRVNSHHHQGISRPGNGAQVTATCISDQLTEALEWTDQTFALGVQWHPEAMAFGNTIAKFVRAASLAANTEVARR